MNLIGMSDKALLAEIGGRIRGRRLDRNLTQQEVADQAGLTRATVASFERGTPVGMLTLIRILRVLEALEDLDSFLPDTGPSPLQLAKFQGRQRQRASGKKNDPDSDPDPEDSSW